MPVLMGILMGISFYRGNDVSVFPNAQMYYPAAGVMIAVPVSYTHLDVYKRQDEMSQSPRQDRVRAPVMPMTGPVCEKRVRCGKYCRAYFCAFRYVLTSV